MDAKPPSSQHGIKSVEDTQVLASHSDAFQHGAGDTLGLQFPTQQTWQELSYSIGFNADAGQVVAVQELRDLLALLRSLINLLEESGSCCMYRTS